MYIYIYIYIYIISYSYHIPFTLHTSSTDHMRSIDPMHYTHGACMVRTWVRAWFAQNTSLISKGFCSKGFGPKAPPGNVPK